MEWCFRMSLSLSNNSVDIFACPDVKTKGGGKGGGENVMLGAELICVYIQLPRALDLYGSQKPSVWFVKEMR